VEESEKPGAPETVVTCDGQDDSRSDDMAFYDEYKERDQSLLGFFFALPTFVWVVCLLHGRTWGGFFGVILSFVGIFSFIGVWVGGITLVWSWGTRLFTKEESTSDTGQKQLPIWLRLLIVATSLGITYLAVLSLFYP